MILCHYLFPALFPERVTSQSSLMAGSRAKEHMSSAITHLCYYITVIFSLMESHSCLGCKVLRTKKDAVSSQLDYSETYGFFVLQGLLHVLSILYMFHLMIGSY